MAELNEVQQKFLASMMKNTITKPEVNWDHVAEEFGITTKSAKERYRQLAIKLGWNEGPKASPNGKTPAKKLAGVAKRSGKVGDKAQQTPKGKAKAMPTTKKLGKNVKDESDGTDELQLTNSKTLDDEEDDEV